MDYGRALEFHHAVIDQVIIIFLRIPSPLVAGNSVYEHPVHAEDRCQIEGICPSAEEDPGRVSDDLGKDERAEDPCQCQYDPADQIGF